MRFHIKQNGYPRSPKDGFIDKRSNYYSLIAGLRKVEIYKRYSWFLEVKASDNTSMISKDQGDPIA